MESTEPPTGEPELFGTETMAELNARQGRLGEAVAIYRRLIANRPGDARHAQWQRRCTDLERTQGRVAVTTPPPPPAPPSAPAASGAALPAPDAPATEPTTEPLPSGPAAQPATEGPTTQPASAPAAPATPARIFELPLVITQPVRSGQVVYARNNDLIVLAAVNPGGQVVADGNIHVYGSLRGRAIAGAQGHDQARIFCQRLDAELLAINGIYLVWEDIPPTWRGQPARISLHEGRCCIGPLSG